MHDGGVNVIHLNFSSAEVDPVYFPQVEVVGDIANAVWRITEGITPQEHWSFDRFLAVKKAADAHLLDGADDSRFPIYPQRLVADVRKVMPDDGIIALDNGVYKIWFARNYRAYAPNTVLLDNALADCGLDYGNPDFVKYAESYGAEGHRVESSSHLRQLLQQCHSSEGVHVIEVPVDYSENDQILNEDIKRLSAKV